MFADGAVFARSREKEGRGLVRDRPPIMSSIRLFRQRSCWVPTLAGWLAILALLTIAGILLLHGLYPFLAEERPVGGEVMIVEGWVPDYNLKQVAADFRNKGYRRIIATGGPLENGSFLSGYRDYATLSAATLAGLGVDSGAIIRVPAPLTTRDRTWESALALKAWLLQGGETPGSADLYSVGPHARRSVLLFRRALGPRVALGVVSLAPQDYNPRKWWTSSNGVRSVIFECLAFFYARFLFRGR